MTAPPCTTDSSGWFRRRHRRNTTCPVGLGVDSPRLDSWGNSVRGTAVLRTLSEDFDLHVFDHSDAPRSPVVAWTTQRDVTSGALAGEFDLISAETVIDLMLAAAAAGSRRIQIDVTGVTGARTVAAELLRVIRSHLPYRVVDVVLDGNLG